MEFGDSCDWKYPESSATTFSPITVSLMNNEWPYLIKCSMSTIIWLTCMNPTLLVYKMAPHLVLLHVSTWGTKDNAEGGMALVFRGFSQMPVWIYHACRLWPLCLVSLCVDYGLLCQQLQWLLYHVSDMEFCASMQHSLRKICLRLWKGMWNS